MLYTRRTVAAGVSTCAGLESPIRIGPRTPPSVITRVMLNAMLAASRFGQTNTLAEPVSPHGLRAGFVTTAYRNGVPDEEIMGHTRHRSLTTMRSYVRRAKLGQISPAGKVGL